MKKLKSYHKQPLLAKAEARAQGLEQRKRIPNWERQQRGKQLVKKIALFLQQHHITDLVLYQTIGSEIDTKPLAKWLRFKKYHLFYPVVKEQTMSFMSQAQTGIALKDQASSLILVPLIAYDDTKHRIGYGKGYYDRTLKHFPNSYKIGIAFEEQKTALFVHEPWDIALDAVIAV